MQYHSDGDDGRWYLPWSQRWIQPDPSGLGPDANPYRYVGNDPTNGTDPSGLQGPVEAEPPGADDAEPPVVGGGSAGGESERDRDPARIPRGFEDAEVRADQIDHDRTVERDRADLNSAAARAIRAGASTQQVNDIVSDASTPRIGAEGESESESEKDPKEEARQRLEEIARRATSAPRGNNLYSPNGAPLLTKQEWQEWQKSFDADVQAAKEAEIPPPLTERYDRTPTQAEADNAQLAGLMRNTPGVVTATGPLNPASGNWLSANTPAAIPSQVAEQLVGTQFNTFGDLRSAIWETIGSNVDLNATFSEANLGNISEGNAPFAPTEFQTNESDAGMRFNLHHIESIESGGSVYDLSNLQIVSPKVHSEIHNPGSP